MTLQMFGLKWQIKNIDDWLKFDVLSYLIHVHIYTKYDASMCAFMLKLYKRQYNYKRFTLKKCVKNSDDLTAV